MGEFRSPSSGGPRSIPRGLFALVCSWAFLQAAIPTGTGSEPGRSDGSTQDIPAAADASSFFELLGFGADWWSAWEETFSGKQPDARHVAELVSSFQKIPTGAWELWTAVPNGRGGARDAGPVIALRSGTVRELTAWNLDPALQARFELPPLYDVVVVPDDDSTRVVHFITAHVPDIWFEQAPAGQHVLARGVAWNSGDAAKMSIIGPRILWLPSAPAQALGISADHVRLASAMFDVGELSAIRQADRKPVGQADREAFWEMLRAARRLRGPLPSGTRPIDSVTRLLTESAKLAGRAVRLRGSIRRVTRIEITDAVERRRLGFDHYYQLDMFADLGDAAIRIGSGKRTKGTSEPAATPKIVTGMYPVTLCTVDLPSELSRRTGDGSADKIHWAVVVEGYFFKQWRYHSDFIAAFGKDARQVVPLVMATHMAPAPDLPGSRSIASGLAVVMVILVAVAAAVVIWMRRRDRAVQERMRRLRNEGA